MFVLRFSIRNCIDRNVRVKHCQCLCHLYLRCKDIFRDFFFLNCLGFMGAQVFLGSTKLELSCLFWFNFEPSKICPVGSAA